MVPGLVEVSDVAHIGTELTRECLGIQHRYVLPAVAIQPTEIGESKRRRRGVGPADGCRGRRRVLRASACCGNGTEYDQCGKSRLAECKLHCCAPSLSCGVVSGEQTRSRAPD